MKSCMLFGRQKRVSCWEVDGSIVHVLNGFQAGNLQSVLPSTEMWRHLNGLKNDCGHDRPEEGIGIRDVVTCNTVGVSFAA